MRKVAVFLFLCSFSWGVPAQHGKSEKSGLYNFPYKGDIWTGEIVGSDPSNHQISLQYTDKKGGTENFSGKLLSTFKAYVKDHPEQKLSSLSLGDKITAYYIAIGQKYPITDEHGKMHDVIATENLIFEAEVFPPKKDKK
jgi:hypothetical protein